MNDVISSILEAEKKADENILKAQEKAKIEIKNADSESERITSVAISTFKLKRKKALKKAEEDAEKKYNDIILEGDSKTTKIVEEAKPKVGEAIDAIVKEILG